MKNTLRRVGIFGKMNSLSLVGVYRFGFNSMEKVNETYGEIYVYNYGFRIYDPRKAKFLSVDPLTKSYPWYTPNQFAGNTPISAIDLEGLEELIVTRWYDYFLYNVILKRHRK